VDICKVAWYSIVGISRSTYLDHEKDSKCGIKQRLHENSGMKKKRFVAKHAKNQLFINQCANIMPHQMKEIGNG
jgi:hypothetical protein